MILLLLFSLSQLFFTYFISTTIITVVYYYPINKSTPTHIYINTIRRLNSMITYAGRIMIKITMRYISRADGPRE